MGKIPEHWEVQRLASFWVFSKGSGFSKNDLTKNGLPAILYGDIYTKYDHEAKVIVRYISDNLANKSIKIVNGILLFTGSGETKEDIGKCVVYSGDESVYVGGDVIIYEQHKNNSYFLSYILNTEGIKEEKAKTSKGEIIVHTYGSKLRNLYISILSSTEQELIVNFLDNKTSQIDKAIASKQKQITLLKEWQQIIIQDAVTKGINADVKMKYSGIEWIDDIPEHWHVKKGKYLFYEVTERSLEGKEELLSVSHLTGVTPRSEKNVSMFMAADYSGSKLCEQGDLVYNIMWAWMGALGVSDQVGIVSPSYGVYRQLACV